MTTSYKPISFSPNESLTRAKLNQMAANDQWFFENFPRIQYNAHKVQRTSALKIASGVMSFAKTTGNSGRGKNVYFGTYFSAGCRPIVVGTPVVNPVPVHRRMIAVVEGLSATRWPDHRGFRLCILPIEFRKFPSYIPVTTYCHWVAIGY